MWEGGKVLTGDSLSSYLDASLPPISCVDIYLQDFIVHAPKSEDIIFDIYIIYE